MLQSIKIIALNLATRGLLDARIGIGLGVGIGAYQGLKYHLLLKKLINKYQLALAKGYSIEGDLIRFQIRKKRDNLMVRILNEKDESRAKKLEKKLMKGDYLLYKANLNAIINDSNNPEILDSLLIDSIINVF